MKRGVFDILRRGFDNTVANWQISLIRFLEAILFIAIFVGALIVIIVPIILSLGLSMATFDAPEEIAAALEILATRWMLLIWIVLGVTAMFLVFMLIHSFVEAGCIRVLVDGDRKAGAAVAGPRARYRAFTLERFLDGAKEGWWTIFWIYNIVWGLACLVLLLPLIPTLALVLIFRAQEGIAVLSGCLGLVVTMVFALVVTVIAAVWSNRAIVAWGARDAGAREAVAVASSEIRADLGRHVLTAIALFVVTMAASAFFASFSMFAGFGEAFGRGNDVLVMMMLPVRIAGSVLNSAFSAIIGSWFLASYTAIELDGSVQASRLPSVAPRQAGGPYHT